MTGQQYPVAGSTPATGPAPIPVRVTRYRCPCCGRSHSSRRSAVDHIGRCWRNPAARGCKTCRHFDAGTSDEPEVGYPGSPESCAAGVSLDGRSACGTCGGYGAVLGEDLGVSECPTCAGDGAEVKSGPIVGCDRWEATR